VEYVTEKWGGNAHKSGTVRFLGHDQFGSWLWGPSGRHIQLGETGSFVTEQDAVILLPTAAWWACSWWIGHPEVEQYVDICTPSRREEDRITHIDLDLDVIRFRDGRVEIDDRDEFEAHLVEYGYPAEIVDGANAAAEEVFDLVSRKASPFDGSAAEQWVGKSRALDRSEP
jgi:protein associated with RNAse G/E